MSGQTMRLAIERREVKRRKVTNQDPRLLPESWSRHRGTPFWRQRPCGWENWLINHEILSSSDGVNTRSRWRRTRRSPRQESLRAPSRFPARGDQGKEGELQGRYQKLFDDSPQTPRRPRSRPGLTDRQLLGGCNSIRVLFRAEVYGSSSFR